MYQKLINCSDRGFFFQHTAADVLYEKSTLTHQTIKETDISVLHALFNVVICSGITAIDNNAFQNSTLTQITIPNSGYIYSVLCVQ